MPEYIVNFARTGRPAEPDGRLDAPAFHRNCEPIWSVLGTFLAKHQGDVLELGSGTGQHAAEYARRAPRITWWPSDLDDAHLKSIAAWRDFAKAPNIQEPQTVDLLQPD